MAKARKYLGEARALAQQGHRCRDCGTGETPRFHKGRGVLMLYRCDACHNSRARERHEFAANWGRGRKNA